MTNTIVLIGLSQEKEKGILPQFLDHSCRPVGKDNGSSYSYRLMHRRARIFLHTVLAMSVFSLKWLIKTCYAVFTMNLLSVLARGQLRRSY